MTDSIRAEPSDDLGANAWVVDEMRDLWAADPASVDEAWRALFEGETPDSPAGMENRNLATRPGLRAIATIR